MKEKVLVVKFNGHMIFGMDCATALLSGIPVDHEGRGSNETYTQSDTDPEISIVSIDKVKLSKQDTVDALRKKVKELEETNSSHWNARWKQDEEIKNLKTKNDALQSLCLHKEDEKKEGEA